MCAKEHWSSSSLGFFKSSLSQDARSRVALLDFAAAALTAEPTAWEQNLARRQAPAPLLGQSEAHSGRQALAVSSDVGMLCNASVVLPYAPPQPRSFELEPQVVEYCEKIVVDALSPDWPGQNRCWEWMKDVGCYAADWGRLSWKDAQARTAQSDKAPYPEQVRFSPLSSSNLCERYELGDSLQDIGLRQKAVATAWVASAVEVFVVNLPTDVSRWATISERLKSLGIAFKHISGLDFTVPNAYKEAKRKGWVPMNFNYSAAHASAETALQSMSGIVGTMGCAAAHLRAMELASRSKKSLVLILEDDVVLEDDFAGKLHRLVEGEAPCDWQVISLKTKCPYGQCVTPHLTRVAPDGNAPAERCHHGVNYGFYAMLYRRDFMPLIRESLMQIIWDEERPHCLDVDVALASISNLVAYYAVPGMQFPGFLTEGGHGSSRVNKNSLSEPVDLAEEDAQLFRERVAKRWGMPSKSCFVYGCGTFSASNICQCNPLCEAHFNCCHDYADRCVTTTISTVSSTTLSSTTASSTTFSPTTSSSTTLSSTTSSETLLTPELASLP